MAEQEKIWLSSPHMGENEQQYVNEAFKTNWIAPLGPHVNGFEADLQEFNKVPYAAALTSGTGAIHIALDLLDIGPGDVVFVQSFTFCGSANPITYRGATPVFIESEPNSWNMCPKHLEKAILAIQDKTSNQGLSPSGGGARLRRAGEDLQPSTLNLQPKAIMPVHLYGMPANMDAIMAVANKYNLPVVEDAAESLGSTYHGKKTGSIGKMGVYSFNGNKIITTSGGGALVSHHKDLVDRARFLATQARDEAPHYQHSVIGYNYRLSNVLAGIGRGQMQVLPERIAQRRANWERYRQYFSAWNEKGYHIQFQEEQEGSWSNRWLTCILIDPTKNQGLTREKIRLALAEENIEARPLWKPMHLQPVFKDYPFFGDGTAENLFNIGLCLPSGSNLTDHDFTRIFKSLDQVLQNH